MNLKIGIPSFIFASVCINCLVAAETEGGLRGTQQQRNLYTAHDNYLYFDPVDFNGLPSHELVDFKCASSLQKSAWDVNPPPPNSYTITCSGSSCQPWSFKGCSMHNGAAQLYTSAGRHKSNGPAAFFNGGIVPDNGVGADIGGGQKLPSQLNFAMNLDLEFTYKDGTTLTVKNVRIGQGSTTDLITGEPDNNWWVAGEDFVINEVGIVWEYNKLKALPSGETMGTIAIGWMDTPNNHGSGGPSYTFQLAYCQNCTMSLLGQANQLAMKEVEANEILSMASALEEEEFDEEER